MKNALLVIDAQKIYTDEESDYFCEGGDEIIENINKIIKLFKKTEDLIIYIRHIHKKDGSDLGRMYDFTGEFEDFEFKEDDPLIEYDDGIIKIDNSVEIIKTRYSAFINTNLDEILKKNKITRITITGFMTNFCCESTARDAHDLDYFVDFIIDATGTPGLDSYAQEEVRNYVSELLDTGFAVVYKTKDYLK